MPMKNPLSDLLYLWPRRTLFVGRLSQPIEFCQAAASLVVGIEGPVQLALPDTQSVWHEHALMIAPGKNVRIDTGGQLVAACYLDALGRDFRLLSQRMARHEAGVYSGLEDEQHLKHWLSSLYSAPTTATDTYDRLESLINPGSWAYPTTEPRVARVVELIQSEVATNVSVEELASAVNLSVSRLVELFRAEVGVPVRRYRQWHRLFVTFTGIERGASLTESAIAAGFADSSHFSHTFRMTLGMKPSDIVAMLSGRIYVGGSDPLAAIPDSQAGAVASAPADNPG